MAFLLVRLFLFLLEEQVQGSSQNETTLVKSSAVSENDEEAVLRKYVNNLDKVGESWTRHIEKEDVLQPMEHELLTIGRASLSKCVLQALQAKKFEEKPRQAFIYKFTCKNFIPTNVSAVFVILGGKCASIK